MKNEQNLSPVISVTEKKDSEFESFVHQRIMEFNNRHSPHHLESRKPGVIVPLNIMVKNGTGVTVGGLTAFTCWDWLNIEDFYLPEEYRGQGLGTRVLSMAEKIAFERGCKRCRLTTFEFQAKVFYENRGYMVAGKLEDYPPGSVYYWMRKDFL